MFKSIIISIIFATQILAQTYFPGDCPQTTVVNDFQLERYLNLWYEVRTYSVPWRASGRCTQALYGLYPNGTVSILNKSIVNGEWQQLLTSAKVIRDGVLAISGPSNPFDDPNYYVLGTDYANYAIGHSCRDNGTHAGHFAWVLSRQRFLDHSINSHVDSILLSNGVPLEPLLDVDHDGCVSPPDAL